MEASPKGTDIFTRKGKDTQDTGFTERTQVSRERRSSQLAKVRILNK